MTSFRKLAYAFYAIVRWAVRATGLIGPVRKVAGPTVGRLLFKFSSGKDGFALVQGHKMYLASQGSYPPVDMLVDTPQGDIAAGEHSPIATSGGAGLPTRR